MKELALHILDIIQNSVAAGATLIKLTIKEEVDGNKLQINIKDNGKGMSDEEKDSVVDPFVTSRKTREVGLGLPLLQAAANRCDGYLRISSFPGKGTEIEVVFQYDHIDRAPLGDIPGTFTSILAVNPEINFVYRHFISGDHFSFDSREIKEELEEIEINQPNVLDWIEEYLRENLQKISGGE